MGGDLMDAVSLKLARNYTNEKLNSLPSNAPTKTVSFDGGIYSVGNDVVNGQVSDVVIKGLTATNLVTNGNFETDITGWYAYAKAYTEATFDAGTCKITTLKTHDAHTFQIAQEVAIIDAHKYYLSFDAYSNVSGRTITIGFSNTNVFRNIAHTTGVTVADSWVKFSLIKDGVADVNKLQIGSYNGTGFNDVGDYLKLDNIMFIDLTATFGAGNEPTQEQCDKIFANWFDGTKSTVGALRLKSVGKNLFDESKLESVNGRPTLAWDGKVLSLYDYANTLPYNHSFVKYVKSLLKVGHTYTSTRTVERLSGDDGVFGAVRFYNDTYGSFEIFAQGDGDRKKTFTVPEDFFEKWGTSPLVIYGTLNGTGEQVRISRFQIEESSTATPYEPYKESIVNVNLPEPLRSLPNGAKDEVNVNTGVKTQNTGKIILDGSENWQDRGLLTNGLRRFSLKSNIVYVARIGFVNAICDKMPVYPTVGGYSAPTDIGFTLHSTSSTVQTTGDVIYLTLQDGQTPQSVFSSEPVTLTYQLAQPIITKLPAQPPLQVFENGTVYVEPIGDPAESTVPSVEMTVPTGTSNKFGVATHDYGGAAADWVLTKNEANCGILIVTNAGGAANIIVPNDLGRFFFVKNDSGYDVVVKSAGAEAGTTIADGNSVIVFNTGN